jgi:hypothetical protein
MAGESGIVTRWREGLAAFRETIVIALILALVVFPTFIGNKLRALGVETFDIGGMKVALAEAKSATQKAAGQLNRDNVATDTVLSLLRALEAKAPPQLSAQIAGVTAQLERTQQRNTTLDSTLRRSLAVQDSVLSNVAPSRVAQEGWIFCGKVNDARTSWDQRSTRVIAQRPTDLVPGNEVELTADVYLRDAGQQLEHAQASILGVLGRGSVVEVVTRDSSHAKAGGWFLWARVRRS